MVVEVLYFAALRDLVGVSAERVEVDDTPRSLAEFLVFLTAKHPTLAGRLASVRVAQNEAFADLDSPLRNQDVIALIPPVAGG